MLAVRTNTIGCLMWEPASDHTATSIAYEHVGSTLHSIMGHTLDSLITKVVPPGDYSLWLVVEQVEVLFSRMPRCANDTCFVGEPRETANKLYNILLQKNRYYCSYLRLPRRPLVFKLHFYDEWTCTPTAGYN
jgi:hypothetical protein